MSCGEHEETEEERDAALCAMKWLGVCRRFHLDPWTCTADDLEARIRKGPIS